jgi:hypothetical protein
VAGYAETAQIVAKGINLRLRQNSSTREGVRVFHAHKPCRRPVYGANRLPHQVPGKHSVGIAWHRPCNKSANGGKTAHLVVINVRSRLEDYFVSGAGMGSERNQIAHSSGWNKKTGLMTEHFSAALLQFVYGCIFAIQFLTDLRLRQRFAHSSGRLSDGIAPQVDEFHWIVSVQRRAAHYIEIVTKKCTLPK